MLLLKPGKSGRGGPPEYCRFRGLRPSAEVRSQFNNPSALSSLGCDHATSGGGHRGWREGGAVSVLLVVPESLATGATDLGSIGASQQWVNAAAAAPTTGLAAASADEISAAVASLFT